MQLVVQVSDAKVTAEPDSVLATYSLGSCIGVSVYDPAVQVAGLLHYQLPTSTLDAEKAARQPCMFADTGLNYLLNHVARLGGNPKRLQVKLVGGAAIIADSAGFSIGKRNHAAIRKALFQAGLLVKAEDVGGSSPRTVYLKCADGSLTVKSDGQSKLL